MADINLLQNINSSQNNDADSASSYLNYIGLGIFIIVAAVTVLLYFSATNAQKQLDTLNQEQITAKNSLVTQPGYDRFIKEQSNLKFLKYLLTNHIDWSQVSPAFSKVTLKSVSYNSLVVNQNGMVTISARTGSFAELDKFMKVLSDKTKSPFVESVDLTSVSPSAGSAAGIVFTIDLVVNQSLWSQS
jgi:Tfp pilus assembly protein PilN